MKYIVDDGGDPKLERDRPKDVPSFADFVLEQYMPHAKARKRSWVCDASLLKNHVLPELGNHRMSRIRKVDIISLHNHLYQSGYAAGTANRILILIRYIFSVRLALEVYMQATRKRWLNVIVMKCLLDSERLKVLPIRILN
ncbi:hypothetical protein EBR25_09355 [bacterium]|nr:hypothetical protein [bacterium]